MPQTSGYVELGMETTKAIMSLVPTFIRPKSRLLLWIRLQGVDK